MSESNKCCEKWHEQSGKDWAVQEVCDCPCHSTTPSLEGFKTLIYNLGVAGGVTTSAAIEIKEYAEILLNHQQAAPTPSDKMCKDCGKRKYERGHTYTPGDECRCVTPSLSEGEEWEDGFDEWVVSVEPHHIKAFIRQTLSNERQRMVAIGEELKLSSPNMSDGYADHCRSHNTAIGIYQQKITSLDS